MSVREFGANGDGVADDTEAIHRALCAGGEVRFPRGTYRVTRPLEVELTDHGPVSIRGEGGARLVMAGAGPALRLVGTHAGSAQPSTVTERVWDRERMPVVTGLEIVGAHPEADGLELTGCMQATLTGLLVRECRHAVRLFHRNRNVIVADCHLYHNRGVGLYLDAVNLHQINVHGCHISYNGRGGLVVRDSEVRNLQVVGNDIEYNFDREAGESADLWIETGERSVREGSITGNTIQALESPGGANVRIVGQSPDVAHKAGLLSLCGNLISNQVVNVHLRWARGVIIEGNTFQTGYRHTILAEESSHVVIGPNVFDHNPDYARDFTNGILLHRCRAMQLSGFLMDRCRAGSAEEGGCVEVRECEDISLRDLQILHPEHRGVEVRDSRHCTLRGCHIRDPRPEPVMRLAVRVTGGGANWISGNYLGRGTVGSLHVEAGAGLAEQNHLG